MPVDEAKTVYLREYTVEELLFIDILTAIQGGVLALQLP